jgi:hypothetical protein
MILILSVLLVEQTESSPLDSPTKTRESDPPFTLLFLLEGKLQVGKFCQDSAAVYLILGGAVSEEHNGYFP